jgi:MFS family permease
MNTYSKGAFIWLLAGLFFLYEFFIRAFMGSVAAPLQTALMLSPVQFSMIASAYYFAYSPMQIPVGLLMDRFGSRVLLSCGALFCAVGTLIFSHTHTFEHAWLARFLMGMGSSVGFISLLTLAVNWFPQRFFGFFAGMTQILGMLGPILSGAPLALWLVATNNDWRHILFDVALIGLCLTVLLALIVRNRPGEAEAAFVKKRSTLTLWQRLKLLMQIKAVRKIALYAFFIYGPIPLLGETWGTPYLQSRGFSLTEATSIIAFLWLGLGFGSPIVGLISDVLARRKLMLSLCGLLGLVITVLFILLNSHSVLPYMLLLFFIGVAAGGQTLSFAILAESVPDNMKATAMGFNNMAVMLGGIFSQTIAGLILNHFWQGHDTSVIMLPLAGYQWCLSLVLGFFALSFIMSLLLQETHAKSYVQ